MIDFKFLEEHSDIIKRIQDKKSLVDKARPLPNMALDRVRKDLALEWTYNSNGIEGNSLTLNETRVILEDGITIGGKPINEHFEAINHEKAINYLEELVSPDYSLRSIDILSVHELVLKNINDHFAGRIRNGMVRILGANFTPPAPSKVSDMLDDLIFYTNQNKDVLHPVILPIIFHHKFVWIHPFFDGNGRTGRLIMNLLYLKEGFPPSIILKNDRKKYYSALNQANKGNYSKLALMILQGLERSLNMYINIIPTAYKEYESIASIANEPDVPYSMEYISLLARTGKINAYKEGRNWVTSKKDVIDYFKNK